MRMMPVLGSGGECPRFGLDPGEGGIKTRLVGVVQGDRSTAGGDERRDLPAHRAGTDNGDLFDLGLGGDRHGWIHSLAPLADR